MLVPPTFSFQYLWEKNCDRHHTFSITLNEPPPARRLDVRSDRGRTGASDVNHLRRSPRCPAVASVQVSGGGASFHVLTQPRHQSPARTPL
jgi:hypothetical protein